MTEQKKQSVLVIDDEQIVLDSVSRVLTEEGYAVDTASSGRDGLKYALSKSYDLVLTDIRMPEIGGMRILRDVKRARPTVPVMIITGYATVQSAVQAMKLGAADYIEKPFTPDELAVAVQKAIHAASAETPDEQKIINKTSVLKALTRAGEDMEFAGALFLQGADILDEYGLTRPEKLAILTGDIHWIEEHVGKLSDLQKVWLEQRLSAEIW